MMPTALCSLSFQAHFRVSPKRSHRSAFWVHAAVKDEQQTYETAFPNALEIESIAVTLGRIEAKLDKLVTKDDLTTSVKALDLKIDNWAKALDSKIDNSAKALDLKIDNSAKALDSKIDKSEKTLSLTFDNKLGTSYRFTTIGFIVLFFSILLNVDRDAHSIFGRLAASLLPRLLPG